MSDHAAADDLPCQQIVELLSDYLDGALDVTTDARLRSHLDECPGCVEALAQFERSSAAIGRTPADALEPALRSRLLDSFRNLTA